MGCRKPCKVREYPCRRCSVTGCQRGMRRAFGWGDGRSRSESLVFYGGLIKETDILRVI